MAQRIYQTFKKHNDLRKEETAKMRIIALWASQSDSKCLTESSYGKDMHEELRKNPLSIDKFRVNGSLKWVAKHTDDSYGTTYLYSGQMKDGVKEGLGRLQNENFVYDGEFKNDQFEGYGR